MTLNPFDLPGPQFLTLYGAGLALALTAGAILPAGQRPDGRDGTIADPDTLALLAGGPRRFADAILSRLLARGALAVDGKGLLTARTSTAGHTAVEGAVLALDAPVRFAAVEHALAPHADRVAKALVADGLMADATAVARLRRWRTAPFLLLFGFGAIKWLVGVTRDRPVGFLSLLLLLTAALAAAAWFSVDARTRAGERLLLRERARADRLRRAPTAPETDMAVALFGTAVLAGSAWESYHTMRRPGIGDAASGVDGSDGGSGCGGGGGGCGGGGGGCGGCGS